MEQPDDNHSSRVLQCGRRMFLAALILASKYLQDRNYSARAWSKISGLGTGEINQNEMAFLLAVNWKLHITDEVFQRWTDIVLKYTPSQPLSPGCSSAINEREIRDWKNLVIKLNIELDNVDGIICPTPSRLSKPVAGEIVPVSPRSLLSASRQRSFVYESNDATSTPKSYTTLVVMEPSPATVYTPGRQAPALGLLPTPRLTPQSTGSSTRAVKGASSLLGGKGSMGFAMAQASHASAAHSLDRWPVSTTSSPQSHFTGRCSSLVNSISTASSPESMISDTSRTSRSSSISSASSLGGAPSTKLDVQARCRYAKLCSERYSLRPAIASVPEDYEENYVTSSPESYTGTVGKDLLEMSLDSPMARGGRGNDEAAEAARALQQLHNNHHQPTSSAQSTKRTGCKRSRIGSIENSLQENVRGMLSGQYYSAGRRQWPDSMIHPRGDQDGRRKRVCHASDVDASYTMPSIHPVAGGAGGVGMWNGILQ